MKFKDLKVGMYIEKGESVYLVATKSEESALLINIAEGRISFSNIYKDSDFPYKESTYGTGQYKEIEPIVKDLNASIQDSINKYKAPTNISLEDAFKDGNIITFYNNDEVIAYGGYLISPTKYQVSTGAYREDLTNIYKHELGIKSIRNSHGTVIYKMPEISIGTKLLIYNITYLVIQINDIEDKYVVISDTGKISSIDTYLLDDSTNYKIIYRYPENDIKNALSSLIEIVQENVYEKH